MSKNMHLYKPDLSAMALLALPTSAQSIKDYLPANTTLFVTVPDLSTTVGEFSQMPLSKM